MRGKKPTRSDLKVVRGNPGRRSVEPRAAPDVRETPLEPPKKLTRPQRVLWVRYVNSAWWLTDFDTPKAYLWVCLQAEYLRSPAKMLAARLTQLRLLGTELGFDPAARSRVGAGAGAGALPEEDFSARYFKNKET